MSDSYPFVERRRGEFAEPFNIADQAASELLYHLGGEHFDVAVVLGSGWGDAVWKLGKLERQIPLGDVPGFTASSVPGHEAVVWASSLGAKRLLIFQGRVHLYEGHTPARVVHPVRTAIQAGCQTVLLTNAAGSINPDFKVGTGVLIADHINLTGFSALTGSNPPERYGSRFVDLTNAYSPRLRQIAQEIAPELGEGVYAAMHGPNYETPAEIRMLRTMGADLVGMSTVLETMAARHLGAEVLGLSLVTNEAAGQGDNALDHAEVVEIGESAAGEMGEILAQVVERL